MLNRIVSVQLIKNTSCKAAKFQNKGGKFACKSEACVIFKMC